jgi:hypothetical protein
MRTSRLAFLWLCVPAAGLAVLLSCSGGGEEPGPRKPALDPAQGVAQIRLGTDVRVKQPGERNFTPWKQGMVLKRGVTLNIPNGIASFLFMNNVEVQLGDGAKECEIILEGPVGSGPAQTLVMGLKKGEVRVNSHADQPVALMLPHGRVQGMQAYFKVDLERDRRGGYRAKVQSFSPNVTVANEFGTVEIPYWGVVRMDDQGPPTVIRQVQQPR